MPNCLRWLFCLALLPCLALAQDKEPVAPNAAPPVSFFAPPTHGGSYAVHEQLSAETGFVLVGRTGPFVIPDQGTIAEWVDNNAFAPPGAVITRIDFRFKLEDEAGGNGQFYCGDYDAWLSGSDTPTASAEVLIMDYTPNTRNDEGGDDDPENDNDIEIEWRTTDAFNGQTANQYWGMQVTDGANVDDGQLTFFELRIYYRIAGDMLYWVDAGTDKIQRAPADGVGSQGIHGTGVSLVAGLGIDLDGARVYWVDPQQNWIKRINLDGSGVETLQTGLSTPLNIALDPAGGKMYWTDAGTDKIQRKNMDGTGSVEDLATAADGLDGPDGIALDLTHRFIYWTDSGTDKIQRKNLDGTGAAEDLLTSADGLTAPNDIALDVAGDKMYFIDGFKIQRTNLAGTAAIEDLITSGISPSYLKLDLTAGKMYWTDSGTDAIRRANLDGTDIETVQGSLNTPKGLAVDFISGNVFWADIGTLQIHRGRFVKDLITTGVNGIFGIALDVAAYKMYWGDAATGKIQRANMDGSGIEDVVTSGIDFFRGIALDLVNRIVYWTDLNLNKIVRADMDGLNSNVQDVVTGLSDPEGIAVDPAGGHLYWTDTGTDRIARADLDGNNQTTLISSGLIDPRGIALDLVNDKMYWADAGTDKVHKANLDGTNVEDVRTNRDNPSGIALDVAADRVYWSETGTGNEAIRRANSTGGSFQTLVSSGLSIPYGLALSIPPPKGDLKVYVKRPAGWGLPHIHYTSTTPDIGTPASPGEPMNHAGCGWYRYTFPGAQEATFTFNGTPVNPLPQTVPLTRTRAGYFLPALPAGGGDLNGTWYDANPDAPCTDELTLLATVWLQGPYAPSNDLMNTDLQAADLIPAAHPFTDAVFDAAPQEYSGTEQSTLVASASGVPIVDWVLVSLRTDANDPATTVATKAGVLIENGTIVDPVTAGALRFEVPTGTYHIVVRTRLHLPVISPPLILGTTNFYDFTSAATQALGINPMVELEPGAWGLWGGDGNTDQSITAFDFLQVWLPENGGPAAYEQADFNMTGDVTAFDFLQVWLVANGQASQVPD